MCEIRNVIHVLILGSGKGRGNGGGESSKWRTFIGHIERDASFKRVRTMK